MAERRGAGLTFGQLITLTFGFLLASVVIFVFGLWVGRDLAEQRGRRGSEAARVPIGAPPEPLAAAPAVPVAPPTVAVLATAVPTATTVRRPATAVPPAATPTRRAASPTPAGANWTVQAYATNDTMRAIMLARTLRSKGYDATPVTKQIGSVTWYTVRVGRFRDRAAAKALENKLRSEEGLEAASVVAQ
jgi:cell division septation protein DedD